MNALDYVRRQLAVMRRQVDSALQGTTDEQFNWLPPGAANSIAATFSHLLATEDFYIQTVLLCTLVVHSAAHAGDIATLKSVRGVKGLPF